MHVTRFLTCICITFGPAPHEARRPLGAVPGMKYGLPLSQRLKKLQDSEQELARFSKHAALSKVDLDFSVDVKDISQEAERLLDKFGETMEFYQLHYTMKGIKHGKWTNLSLKAKNGDMCDDSLAKRKNYVSTPVWHDASAIRKFLRPIEPALRRVRLSVMHPNTMVAWHCDDCPKPRERMGPPDCLGHQNPHSLAAEWKDKFHTWVRLHLMLTTSDTESSIGGLNAQGTSHGNFYLANVAMPHRVDNKGSSSRIALLIDVGIKGQRRLLKQSDLGKSILKAADKLIAADASPIYLQMGRALQNYACFLTTEERYETEWHGRAWSKPFWRPLPPFEPRMFNSPGRCGALGPAANKIKLHKLMLAGDGSQKQKAARRRRRRRTA